MVRRCAVCDKYDPEVQEPQEAICVKCVYWAAGIGMEHLYREYLKAVPGKGIGRC